METGKKGKRGVGGEDGVLGDEFRDAGRKLNGLWPQRTKRFCSDHRHRDQGEEPVERAQTSDVFLALGLKREELRGAQDRSELLYQPANAQRSRLESRRSRVALAKGRDVRAIKESVTTAK
jgi:hypothetical protein